MFRSLFQRIWTAIVAATTGAVLGIVAAIIMSQQHIAPVNTGLVAVWIFAGLGLVFGLIFGGRKKSSPTA
jgi:FtsH-binding integral membrane protein